jgi:tripartite-type tricarboxylate transporter receptor subunit TctC
MPQLNRRQFSLALGAGAIGLGSARTGYAQNYPSKAIRLIVGFAPGGLTDIIARMIAPVLSEQLGQPVIVDNKPGANGNISTAFVAGSDPDGHTLLLSSSAQIVYSPNTYKKLPADPITGLRHITMIGEGDFIFVVNSQVGVNSLEEFVALARTKPGTMNYATGGLGGSLHVVQEMFRQRVGIDIVPVHYKGSAAALTELLSNQVQIFCDGLPSLEPYIKSGKLKPLFVSSAKRMDALPNVPSSTEVKLPEFAKLSNWFGLHAPKGTPDVVIAKLNSALNAAKTAPPVLEKFKGAAIRPVFNSSNEFTAQIEAADKVIAQVTRAGNIQIE